MRMLRWGGRFLLLAAVAYLCAGLYPLLRGEVPDERYLLPALVLGLFGWVTGLLVNDQDPDAP